MKKRIVSLILCGLMVFSAAGCSGGGENKAGKDDVTLTMWTHINEPWNAAYKDAIKEFESENEGGLNLRRSHMMSLNQKYRPL